MRSSRVPGEERAFLLVTSCNEPVFFLGGHWFESTPPPSAYIIILSFLLRFQGVLC
jgi:hypothetical protein